MYPITAIPRGSNRFVGPLKFYMKIVSVSSACRHFYGEINAWDKRFIIICIFAYPLYLPHYLPVPTKAQSLHECNSFYYLNCKPGYDSDFTVDMRLYGKIFNKIKFLKFLRSFNYQILFSFCSFWRNPSLLTIFKLNYN
jgi:hypothetical protein